MPIFATAYLPPIAYIAQMAQFENVTIEQMETFHKQTYRNRTIILTANGLLPLIVPTIKINGNHTLTRDIGITYNENWNIKHWRAIESAYNSSPYFLYYRDGIEKILMTPYKRLIDLNQALLSYLLKKLKIKCTTNFSENYLTPETTEKDFRDCFSIKGNYTTEQFPEYNQVFITKFPFQPNISILDLLFNLGPDSKEYLMQLKVC